VFLLTALPIFQDLYLVFDFMESDLHKVIKNCKLGEVQIKFIIYQILKALKYIHSGSLIHRDLKPSNILINADCSVKVCDFGLSRSLVTQADDSDDTSRPSTAPAPVLTQYIATRWYRAPELVLSSKGYSKAVDIWAVGCILGEMYAGSALFQGKTASEQLGLILQLIGYPTRGDIGVMHRVCRSNISLLESMKSTVGTRPVAFEDLDIFTGACPEAVEFLQQTLTFNPQNRPSAEQLLNHTFISRFRGSTREPVCDRPIEIDGDFMKLSAAEYRRKIYMQISMDASGTKNALDRRIPPRVAFPAHAPVRPPTRETIRPRPVSVVRPTKPIVHPKMGVTRPTTVATPLVARRYRTPPIIAQPTRGRVAPVISPPRTTFDARLIQPTETKKVINGVKTANRAAVRALSIL
jgi:mitogen-activated protein kinase 15